MNDILIYIVSYAGVILIAGFLINFLTQGYLINFLKVKLSRGKKLLVNVKTTRGFYTVTGVVEEDFLIYQDNVTKRQDKKAVKRVLLEAGTIFRHYGLDNVFVDEANNIIYKPNFEGVNTYDPIKFNNLITRALLQPESNDVNKWLKIIAIGLGLLIIGLFLVYNKIGELETLIEGLKTIGGSI
jgi:hypothetical protein